MEKKQYGSKFELFQNIYFKITWMMIIISALIFGLVYLLINISIPAPNLLVNIVAVVFYYHFGHMAYGIISLIYYLIILRKKIQNLKIYKTLIAILITPFSFFAIYMALFLVVLSSCGSN
jgi:XapX domain-containing protein